MKPEYTSVIVSKDTRKKLLQYKLDKNLKSLDVVLQELLNAKKKD